MNIDKIKKAAEIAKTKTSDRRWLAAIDKAVAGVESGWWVITELADGIAVTTETGKTYFANGSCQCKAFENGQACKHRALARLVEIANKETTDPAVSLRSSETRNTCTVCGNSWTANYASDYCPIHAKADPAMWRPPAPPCPVIPRIVRSVERDQTGARVKVVRCDNWVV